MLILYMEIFVSVTRGYGLRKLTLDFDLYVHDMGTMAYIVMGNIPLVSIVYINPTRLYQDEGWYISGSFGMYDSKLKKKFSTKDKAIKKVVKFLSNNLDLVIYKIDNIHRFFYKGAKILIHIEGNSIKVLNVTSNNVYEPYKVNKNKIYTIDLKDTFKQLEVKPEDIMNEGTFLKYNNNFKRMISNHG